ncbi:hypothetical protein B0H19DRAFT_1259795 [Mycena capillaripes]|nr:hypothetical protein B0H19DRAFT_1259795 [Mycena capillaripes]
MTSVRSSSASLEDLPTELLLEILAIYPDSPLVFFSPLAFREYGVHEREFRRQILQSLSQTCTTLRNVFLPLLWNIFDVTVPKIKDHYTQNTILQTAVFPFIQNIHINFSNIPALDADTTDLVVRFLCVLPNFVGLRIRLERSVMPLLIHSIGSHTFPTVTSLCVPGWLDPLFPAFTGVTSLTCPAIFHDMNTLAAAQQHFSRLDTLAGLSPYKQVIEDVFEKFPRLRRISTSGPIDLDLLPLFSLFRNLSELSLAHRADDEDTSAVHLILAAQTVLRRSKSRDRKLILIWEFTMLEGYSLYPRVIHVGSD